MIWLAEVRERAGDMLGWIKTRGAGAERRFGWKGGKGERGKGDWMRETNNKRHCAFLNSKPRMQNNNNSGIKALAVT